MFQKRVKALDADIEDVDRERLNLQGVRHTRDATVACSWLLAT